MMLCLNCQGVAISTKTMKCYRCSIVPNAPGVCEGERKRVLGAALFPFTGSNHLNQPFCKHHVGRSLPCRSGLRTTYYQRLVKGETLGVGQNLGLHKPLKKAADRVRMDFAAWQILTYEQALAMVWY